MSSALRASQQASSVSDAGTGKRVRVGIIGAENSHTVNFGRIFNIEKKFPGVEAVALWGETDEFAQRASERGQIPKIVKDPLDLMGQVDAVIIDHRHAKYHAAAAQPFVTAGIPTFVDKPFTYRVGEARHLLDLAETHKTPITCLSSVGYGPAVDSMAAQISQLEDVITLVITGPADVTSKYGGIFFYGVHFVEQLFKIFGDDAHSVRATRHGGKTTFQFKFDSGRLATAVLAPERDVYAITSKGAVAIAPGEETGEGLQMYAAIVKMFQTGEEPRTHDSIIRTVAALEAMERSAQSEDWEQHLLV